MENEAKIPVETQIITNQIEQRKNYVKNFLLRSVKEDYDKYFIITILIALILRIMVFIETKTQPIWWDAADFLSTAKRWGLGLNIIDMWYYRRGLLWPLIESLFFKVGLGEISIRVLIVFLSTGIIIVTYLLISELFNKKIALLTSIGVTFSWVYLFFSGRPMTEIPSSFFLLTAILFFWNIERVIK